MIEGLPLLAWPRSNEGLLTTLIYHRVLPQDDPLRPGEPDAELFSRQMAFLAKHFTVMPLLDAVEAMQRRMLPKRACCITFDDGYADNLTVALPILERYRLPATVFVATGYLDGGRMFNDAAIELVARVRSPQLDFRALGLGSYPTGNVVERRATINALQAHLKYQAPDERNILLARMTELAGCGDLPDNLMLTTGQVKELSDRGVDIGGHTVSHAILNTLDDEAACREIVEGKRRLESITGRPVKAFAYPNGRPGRDYSAQHVGMLQALGFSVAVTTAHGVGTAGSDMLQLPRFTPWGRSVVMLATRMTRNAMSR